MSIASLFKIGSSSGCGGIERVVWALGGNLEIRFGIGATLSYSVAFLSDTSNVQASSPGCNSNENQVLKLRI